MGFSRFFTRIIALNLRNFLRMLEGPNQEAKLANNAKKLGQHRFLDRQTIAAVGH